MIAIKTIFHRVILIYKTHFHIPNILCIHLSTAIPNTYKETHLYVLKVIVKTDKFVHHTLCILWRFGCFSEFCGLQFRECANVEELQSLQKGLTKPETVLISIARQTKNKIINSE